LTKSPKSVIIRPVEWTEALPTKTIHSSLLTIHFKMHCILIMGVTWFRLEQSGLCACRTGQFR